MGHVVKFTGKIQLIHNIISKFTINCAKLILGILLGNISVKKCHKNIWALKSCHNYLNYDKQSQIENGSWMVYQR